MLGLARGDSRLEVTPGGDNKFDVFLIIIIINIVEVKTNAICKQKVIICNSNSVSLIGQKGIN